MMTEQGLGDGIGDAFGDRLSLQPPLVREDPVAGKVSFCHRSPHVALLQLVAAMTHSAGFVIRASP